MQVCAHSWLRLIVAQITGLSWPAFSASSTIRRAILSFTDPPALKNSHFATERESAFKMPNTHLFLRKGCTLTHFTFETSGLGNPVDPDEGCVADGVQHIWHDARPLLGHLQCVRSLHCSFSQHIERQGPNLKNSKTSSLMD